MSNNGYICPICGKHRFTQNGDYDICPHCGWENDAVMNDDPSYWGGANDLCQLDFKLRYMYYVTKNPQYHWRQDHFPEVSQIEEANCPVCKKMRFVPLRWDEIYCGVLPSDIYCMSCGWHYDINQLENHNLKNGANDLSVNEYKELYKSKMEENPNYNYFEEITEAYVPTPHICPVCGKYEFEDESSYDICPVCGWEDDGVQLNDPDFAGGANQLSLKQYRNQYCEKIKIDPNYRWEKSK